MQPMEAADEEVANEAIEEARVVAEQDAEAVTETVVRWFIRDECQVGCHYGGV
jgi:hypothetical protein